ncbi:hypothetical protein HOLleu_34754 [Holothuria leucospilota]|uniref:Peptidase aspartic putative domain-containing protein n=1 Tax=Holothuria leucospilota TaxID=206669 RepID=A0A9Q1BGG3_HOLLE|nr:hypothetical protein HOLleu_34754 [Holothuria leucospilota]
MEGSVHSLGSEQGIAPLNACADGRKVNSGEISPVSWLTVDKTGSFNRSQGTDDDDCVSQASSRHSSGSTGSRASVVRLKEARIRAEVARLKREQIERRQDLEREKREFERKLEMWEADAEQEQAEVELKLWEREVEEEMSPYLGIGEDHSSKACVGSYSEDNTANHWYQGGSQESPPTLSVPARQGINPKPTGYNIPKHVGPGIDNEQVTMNQTFSNMFDVFNFPKPEITRFDGNPGNFWTFVNGFEVNIASKNIDDRSKLMYLIQFCVGQAKESIEDCALMPPGEGYRTAWQILRNQFGQGHLVTKCLVDKVVNREPIKPNDGEGLWDLARQMRKCQITLSQLGNVASMNNADTLMKVQNLLPLYFQKEWAKRAHGLIQMNVEPQFYHMTEFLEQSAQIANNMYGQNIGAKSRVERSQVSGSKGTGSSKFGQTGKNQKVTTLATGSSPDSGFQGKSGSGGHRYCILCHSNHDLSSCFQFKKYSLDKRVAFVRERRLCNNCLIPNHLAKGCLVAPKCTIDDFHKKHHTLLHFGNRAPLNVGQGSQDSGIIQPQRGNGDVIGAGVENKGNQNENKVDFKEVNATRPQDQPKVCLRAVPVTVNGTGTTRVQTWALLDDGSNISLCDQRLVSLLRLKGKPTKFNLNTVIGEGPSEFGLEVEMTAGALSGNGVVHLPKVWSVDNLPIDKGSLPGVEDIQRWPHLKGIEFPQIEENDVMLLIGCDVPEAFWALEEKRGRRKEPFAIRSLLGWTIMGPVGTSATRVKGSVHHVRGEDLSDQFARIWESDFGGLSDLNGGGESQEDRKATSIMEGSVQLVDGHYKIALPWRHPGTVLPNNREMAVRRLNFLKKRLERDTVLCERYIATMNDYFSKGYAKKVHSESVPAVCEEVCTDNKQSVLGSITSEVDHVESGGGRSTGTTENEKVFHHTLYCTFMYHCLSSGIAILYATHFCAIPVLPGLLIPPQIVPAVISISAIYSAYVQSVGNGETKYEQHTGFLYGVLPWVSNFV